MHHGTSITLALFEIGLNSDWHCGTGEIMFEQEVPKRHAGLIIGRGGETIRSLQDQTGASIQTKAEGNDNPDVVGPRHCITAVHHNTRFIYDDSVLGFHTQTTTSR